MDGTGFLVAILIPLGAFAMIFGIVYIKSKESMAMIEKGMNPKQSVNSPAPFRNLKWALLLVGAGTGLLLAYLIDIYVLRDLNAEDNPAIYFALLAICGGLGLFISYRIEKKEMPEKTEEDQ